MVALTWQFCESCLCCQIKSTPCKPPFKMLANCIFTVIYQIFDSPIIPHYKVLCLSSQQLLYGNSLLRTQIAKEFMNLTK